MCIDYCDIIGQTEKDAYPLPRIDSIWPVLSISRYFTFLASSWNSTKSRLIQKTSSKQPLWHKSLFINNVMVFGLFNSPATFKRLLKQIFGTLIKCGIYVYLDDVLMYATTLSNCLTSCPRYWSCLIQLDCNAKLPYVWCSHRRRTISSTLLQCQLSNLCLQNWKVLASGSNLWTNLTCDIP